MRLYILSDLHLEFAPFAPPKVNADAIVFAGDIHTGKNGLKWIRSSFPDKPVLYVLGNHEFYGQKIPKLTEELKQLVKGTNIHVMENDAVRINDVWFLGATLWTDFKLDGDIVLAEAAAVTSVTDFKRIRVTPSYRRFRPADARRFHAQSVQWLLHQTKELAGQKIVIVTHHAPSPRSIPLRYRGSPFNPAFASNLEQLIEATGATLWIHGHIHEATDYLVGSTCVMANPRGYPNERFTGFEPSLVVDV